jgi:hypothetical protein
MPVSTGPWFTGMTRVGAAGSAAAAAGVEEEEASVVIMPSTHTDEWEFPKREKRSQIVTVPCHLQAGVAAGRRYRWRRCTLRPRCRPGRRKDEGADLQTLVPQYQAILVPVEQLQAIAAAAAKDEEVPRQGIARQMLADQLGQRIETFAHIDRFARQEDAYTGRQV